jgi:hypothetical protein
MQQSPLGTLSFNPYSAGNKRYSNGSAPTQGPVDPEGYIDREARNRQKRNVMLQWLKDNTMGAHGTANAMRRG